MNKFIAIIAIIATVAVFAVEQYKFPGWDKDAAVYNADIAMYEAAPAEQKPFSATNYNNLKLARALAGMEVDSFGVIYSAAQTAFPGNDKYACNYACARALAIYNADYKSQKGIDMLRGAYDLARQKNTHHGGVIAASLTRRKALGLTDGEAVAAILDALDVIECGRHKDIAIMLNVLYDMLPDSSVAEAEQLAALKKFNRRFSKELLGKNKEQWEPVIAKLRTVIASY